MCALAAMSVCVCFYSHKKDRTQDLARRIAGVSSKLKINDSIQFFYAAHNEKCIQAIFGRLSISLLLSCASDNALSVCSIAIIN
jgi:hypothetical protein